MAKGNLQRRPRGRPPKKTTGAEFLRRFGHKALVWCDKNSKPVADQTTPTGYIRPLTKEEEQQAQIAAIDEALAADPDFERCDADGMPDPNGTHWKLRADPVA